MASTALQTAPRAKPVLKAANAAATQFAIQVSELRKTYPGGIEAVAGISFDVRPGEIFGLLGPNGAGKSTTIGMLTGGVRPTSGSAAIAGHNVAIDPIGARQQIGVVFQDSVLDPEFSGRQNLELHARLWRMDRFKAGQRIISLGGLMELDQRLDDKVTTYSGGMKRRLELARALLANPKVLFLDEPTSGLDPAVREELWGLIERARREDGVTVLLTTHYLEEAERLCDRVGIVFQGRMVALGRPVDLLRELGDELVEVRVAGNGPAAEAAISWPLPAGAVQRIGSTFTFAGQGSAQLAPIIESFRAAGIGVVAGGARRPTLNDLFNRLTGAALDG